MQARTGQWTEHGHRERSNCNSGQESQQVEKIRAAERGVVTTSAVQCSPVQYNKIGRARIDLYLIGTVLWDYSYNINLNTLCSSFLF